VDGGLAVKRTGALLLLSLFGIFLLLFPGLWHELGRRLRFALLLASGLMLAAGVGGALAGRFETLSVAERAMTVVGITLLAGAWVGVARSSLRR